MEQNRIEKHVDLKAPLLQGLEVLMIKQGENHE